MFQIDTSEIHLTRVAAETASPSTGAPSADSRPISRRQLQGSYDAARQSRVMQNYWQHAEIQSANAAHSPAVQKVLRARSRYEFSNNGFVQRMVLQKANDTIGTCPRVQLNSQSDQGNRFIEEQWLQWSKAVYLGARLRLSLVCRQVDGAGLVLKAFNPKLRHAVKLDLRVIDVDRLHTPDMFATSRYRSDGLKKDRWGNLQSIDLLRDHPNADYAASPLLYDTIPADFVIYWISSRFAEQDRAVPETAAILNPTGQSRRFRQTVLTAAELAAAVAGIIRTNTGAVDEAADDDEVGDLIQFEMGHLVTLPRGWGMDQMKAEQPTATFAEFTNELSKEQAGGMGMSHHKATGDYSQTNYVSGKLSDRDYLGNIDIERHDLGEQHLSPLFCDFARELAMLGLMPAVPALNSEQYLPKLPALQAAAGYMDIIGRRHLATWLRGGREVPTLADLALAPQELHAAGYEEASLILQSLPHEWFWDQPRDTDPTKEAIGRTHRIKSGTNSRRREVRLATGQDIDTIDRENAADFGLTVDEYRQLLAQATFAPKNTGAAPNPPTGATSGKAQSTGAKKSDSQSIAAIASSERSAARQHRELTQV